MKCREFRNVLFMVLSIYCVSWAASVYSLYSDHRAMKVDDILTVLIVESAKAGSGESNQYQ
jgi:flagellar basal body L-ring protein FlgH